MPSPAPSHPQFAPTPRELDDIELLRTGALAPQFGFRGPGEDVTLCVPLEIARQAHEHGKLEIIDGEGVPLAIVSADETFEAACGQMGIIGDVHPLPGTVQRAFGDHYLSPSASMTRLPTGTLTVPVTGALTARDLETISARSEGRPVLMLVLTGAGTPRALSAEGLMRATLAASRDLTGTAVIATPVAARARSENNLGFQRRVVAAYAPGLDVHWPEGIGPCTPAVAEVVSSDRPSGVDQGLVVFFTGLSGSGKSTISQALRHRIVETGERTISLLDGDIVRQNLSRGLTFSREDRETNIQRIAWVAAEIARHGAMAICSPIAPFDDTRKRARQLVTAGGAAFVLVHVATPLEKCESRDRKGLYAKARRGEVPEFTGISSPYEVPDDADVVLDTSERTVESVLDELLHHLVDGGWLTHRVLDRVTVETESAR